jgi:hypothetical protein
MSDFFLNHIVSEAAKTFGKSHSTSEKFSKKNETLWRFRRFADEQHVSEKQDEQSPAQQERCLFASYLICSQNQRTCGSAGSGAHFFPEGLLISWQV